MDDFSDLDIETSKAVVADLGCEGKHNGVSAIAAHVKTVQDQLFAQKSQPVMLAMKTPQHEIDNLLKHPTEGLNVEVKSWLDPAAPAGIAKIVRAVFALRNRNGGYLIIGLDDKNLKPDLANKPEKIRETYHIDTIQGIVSKYASSLFEIEVGFGQIDGVDIAAIVVPIGVSFPVATKAHLNDVTGKKLIEFGQVYFRTLRANGTPSTAVAQPQDWKDIVDVCFENREADLGRFLRRLVGSGTGDLATLINAVAATRKRNPDDDNEGGAGAKGAGTTQVSSAKPLLNKEALSFLEDGVRRFSAEAAARKLNGEALRVSKAGSWEVSLVIDPQKINQLPTEKFRQVLASSNPRYSGWPVWLDSSTFQNAAHRPVVKSNGWETFIVSLESWSKHLDFYRFDPNGKFYLHRNLQDDTSDRVAPGTALDPILVIIRIAEAVAVGLTFAKALEWKPEDSTLGFAARWTNLRGRTLESWANPAAYISPHGHASDDAAVGFSELRLDTPINAIAPTVQELVRPLFVLFGGFEIPQAAVEEWVKRLVERRLDF
jgi:hypothetical protein